MEGRAPARPVRLPGNHASRSRGAPAGPEVCAYLARTSAGYGGSVESRSSSTGIPIVKW